MKKEVVFAFILFSLILIPLALADETSQINNAYSCLKNKINSSGCSALSFEEKTFSLLSVRECYSEVAKENSSEQCWPKNTCTIKSTSQAILGLKEYKPSYNISSAKSWLFSNTKTPENLNWFLEINTDGSSTCTIYYAGYEGGVSLNIADDMKLSSSGLGNCLALTYNNYLIQVSPSCYNMDIDISCNKGFETTLLFKKGTSDTFYVLYNIHGASALGTTTEKINSLCFKNPNSNNCDYEGSLWASQILYYFDEDVSPFLPYLIAFLEDNSNYLPESFLYYLTGQFRNELLFKQVAGKYWFVSGNRFYDTALALLPLQFESPTQKQNSKNWLLDVQESSGCWNNGNLRDTAFILYSVWPRDFNGGDDEGICGDGIINIGEQCDGTNLGGMTCEDLNYASGVLQCYSSSHTYACKFNTSGCVLSECEDDDDCPLGYFCSSSGNCYADISDIECEYDSDCLSPTEECLNGYCVEASLDCVDQGYFCMSAIDCKGNVLSNYICSGLSKCCTEPKSYGTCFSQGGEICDSDETCKYNRVVEADNLLSGEVCCLSVCEKAGVIEEYTCNTNGGLCRTSCLGDEQEYSHYSCPSNSICCISESVKKKNNLFIWILLILILLTVIGIVFREKIKEIFMKMKHERKSPGNIGRPLFGGFKPSPPSSPQMRQIRRPVPRRIIHPSQQSSPPRLPPKTAGKKSSKELDDVLEKLRKIGGK